tara:strand:- start:993 stop:1418 length:426 start_codon:yes stop_codon:yes gene_type:complete
LISNDRAGSTPAAPTTLTFNSFFIMFSSIKHLIPQPHGYMDSEQRYNVGLTWIDQEGLTDVHNLEIRYVRNNERLAIERGEPQPDGSWAYKETNGTVHTMSAERVNSFMAKTQEHATIMCSMLDKINQVTGETVDTEAAPA